MKLAHLLHRGQAAPNLRERAVAIREGLSRREAVLSAAVASVPLPAIAASIEEHPDASLIALWQRREVAHRAEQAAAAAWDALPPAFQCVPIPEALFVQSGDEAFGFVRLAVRNDEGRFWYCVGDPEAGYPAARLRRAQRRDYARPVRPEDNLPSDAHTVVELRSWPEAQARADAIVAAWDARQAEIALQQESSGYNAAKASWQACDDALDAIEDEIAAAEASTLAGLAIQARLVQTLDERGFRPTDDLISKIVTGVVALGTPAAFARELQAKLEI